MFSGLQISFHHPAQAAFEGSSFCSWKSPIPTHGICESSQSSLLLVTFSLSPYASCPWIVVLCLSRSPTRRCIPDDHPVAAQPKTWLLRIITSNPAERFTPSLVFLWHRTHLWLDSPVFPKLKRHGFTSWPPTCTKSLIIESWYCFTHMHKRA